MMKKHRTYRPPMLLKEVPVQLERDFLNPSVVDVTQIKSVGQEVKEYDFSDKDTFNFTWGE